MSEMKNLGFDGDPRKNSNLERVTSVEDLESRSWDRDSIDQRFRDVVNAHDTIVNIISDIQSQIDALDSKEEAESKHKGFYDNTEDLAGGESKYHPNPPYQLAWKYKDLHERESRWMVDLMELHRLAERKFKDKALMLLEENRSAEVHDKLLDHLDEKVEDKLDRRLTEEKTEIRQVKSEVKSVAQAMREERRALDRRLESVAEQDGIGSLEERVVDEVEKGLEQFVTDNGLGFEIDRDILDRDRAESERSEAAESGADELSGSGDGDDGFSADEVDEDEEVVVEDSPSDRGDARKEMIEKWDGEFEMMTQQQIADALGKSQAWVSKVKNEESLE